MQQSNQKEILFEAIRKLAVLKGADISEERHKLYCENLSKYSLEKVLSALKFLMETHPRFPDIAHILTIVNPPMSENDKANEVVNAIMETLGRFGQRQALSAKKELGPVAWHVVEGMGGWSTLCMATYSELGTMRAQMREMAKSSDKISKRDPSKAQLPHEKSSSKRLGDMMDEFKELKKLT